MSDLDEYNGERRFMRSPEPFGDTGESDPDALSFVQCDRLESISPLGDYHFRHPEDSDKGLLLLGLVSLVNHSEDPNADVRFVHCEELGWIAELVSRHPIAIGEEITYSGGSGSRRASRSG